MRGRALQRNRELKQTRSMRGRAHSQKRRTQTNTINVRPRAFKQIANSIKLCQCAGARIQRNRERKQTRSMRGRAHSKTLRIQKNKINAKARAFKQSANSRANNVNAPARALNKTANSSNECQCAGARIQKKRELKQTISM